MTNSRFHLEWEWLDAPSASISSHARTWSRLVIRVDDRALTRVSSERTGSTRDGVYLPLMPLAEWVAANWWFLFAETAPAGLRWRSPRLESASTAWFRRHNLLAAREGYPLPDLTIAREDDDLVGLSMRADERVYANAPVRFIESREALVDLGEFRAALSSLIDAVAERLDGCTDADALALVELWKERKGVSRDERLVAMRAAALGRNADDPSSVSDQELAALGALGVGLPESLVGDVLELREDTAISSTRLDAVRGARASLAAVPRGSALRDARAQLGAIDQDGLAYRAGWSLAREFRERVLGADGVLVASALDAAIDDRQLIVVTPGLVDGGGVLGWVEADAEGTSRCVVQPMTSRPGSRFLRARGLGMALLGRRERLVTDAGSRPQRVARAFATELLAPVDVIRQRLRGDIVSDEVVGEIATELAVSRKVVQHQIENHGLAQIAWS